MVFFRHCPIGSFDCAVVGVRRDAKNFIVVFCLAAFEQGVGLLKERLYILGSRMLFFCMVEGVNGGFEVFDIKLTLCLSDEPRERMGVQGESFGAVGSRFLLVDLGRVLV